MTILVDGRVSEKDPSCSTRVMQLKEKKRNKMLWSHLHLIRQMSGRLAQY